MPHVDVFNGDADGICALHQLRLSDPRDSLLITGVKRDIALLEKVNIDDTSSVTVLDVSLDCNRAMLETLLAAGKPVEYFDHHFAGDIPQSPLLNAHINTSAAVCTSLLVNRYLAGAHLLWAVVAAFGDNMHDSALKAARPTALKQEALDKLARLGILLNYNSYGLQLDDLFFHPAALYRRLKPYTNPFDFIDADLAFNTLNDGYEMDVANAHALQPVSSNDKGTVLILPEAHWSRRVGGVFGNLLANRFPQRAHAVLSALPQGGYLVSVRAPLSHRQGADELCRQFETGGGRKAAAGIKVLKEADLDRFMDLFYRQFV